MSSLELERRRLARALRQYLRWQAGDAGSGNAGACGVVPAPASQREAFEARVRERENRKLDQIRSSFDGGSRAEPARPQTDPAPPPVQPARPPSFEHAAPPAQPAREKAEPSRPQPAPWKEFGSRPRPTFQESRPKQSTPSPSPALDDEPPPLEDDAYYPGPAPEDEAPQTPAKRRGGSGRDEARATKNAKKEYTNAEKLEILRNYLGDCRRCGLCDGRTNIVYGVGDPQARIMFIGEAPGFHEDKQGEPFVGKAGALLDKMIGAMSFERSDVYIANVLKCRPPNNRDPAPEEVLACSPFLRKQVQAVSPDVIVALGRFAANILTGHDGSLAKIRGRWHEYEGIPLMPTYHPAYLLRNPEGKRQAWADLKAVLARLDLPSSK